MSGFFPYSPCYVQEKWRKNPYAFFFRVAVVRGWEGKDSFFVSILTPKFYLLRIELFSLFFFVGEGKKCYRNEEDKWMTTCPEKSRVNTSSYQFYGIVGVFIKSDFMMSFSSFSFLPFPCWVRVPRKVRNKNRKNVHLDASIKAPKHEATVKIFYLKAP